MDQPASKELSGRLDRLYGQFDTSGRIAAAGVAAFVLGASEVMVTTLDYHEPVAGGVGAIFTALAAGASVLSVLKAMQTSHEISALAPVEVMHSSNEANPS
jgi:hypothetical protein